MGLNGHAGWDVKIKNTVYVEYAVTEYLMEKRTLAQGLLTSF